MDDQSILKHIEALVAEEHALQSLEQDEAAHDRDTTAEHARLQSVSVELDRCWDLLRRRRALRETGGDPDSAELREPGTVENYLQ